LLKNDANTAFPVEYPTELFETIYPTPPAGWLSRSSGLGWFKITFSSFPEWVNDKGREGWPGFYERLVDAEPDSPEALTLSGYRKLAAKELERY